MSFFRLFFLCIFTIGLLNSAMATASDRMAGSFFKVSAKYTNATIDLSTHQNSFPSDLQAFYQARDWKPLWIDNKGEVKEAIHILDTSWTHGIPNSRYDIERIHSLMENKTPENIIALEIALTQNITKMAQDLSGPYLNANIIDSDSRYWPKPLNKKDILSRLNQKQESENLIKSVTPNEPLYQRLRKELRSQGSELNFADFKTHQIVSNMERMRWLPREKPNKYIFVNIATAQLWAIEDNQLKLEMPVVVGKRWRPTYSFMTKVKGVRFNPRWTVPITIKQYDFLPKLQKDPFALAKKNIEIYDGLGKNALTVAADSVDWENTTRKDLHKIVFRQGPGDDNPLGRYRLIMPNKFNVFLHDTNHPEFFDREKRDLSSGCVRVKYPDQVTAFVLGDKKPDYASKLKTNKEIDIPADHIPVILSYLSISMDNDGNLIFEKDPYRYDTKMAKALFGKDGNFLQDEVASLSE